MSGERTHDARAETLTFQKRRPYGITLVWQWTLSNNKKKQGVSEGKKGKITHSIALCIRDAYRISHILHVQRTRHTQWTNMSSLHMLTIWIFRYLSIGRQHPKKDFGASA